MKRLQTKIFLLRILVTAVISSSSEISARRWNDPDSSESSTVSLHDHTVESGTRNLPVSADDYATIALAQSGIPRAMTAQSVHLVHRYLRAALAEVRGQLQDIVGAVKPTPSDVRRPARARPRAVQMMSSDELPPLGRNRFRRPPIVVDADGEAKKASKVVMVDKKGEADVRIKADVGDKTKTQEDATFPEFSSLLQDAFESVKRRAQKLGRYATGASPDTPLVRPASGGR